MTLDISLTMSYLENMMTLMKTCSLINVAINLRKPPVKKKTITYCKLGSINYALIRTDIEKSWAGFMKGLKSQI